MTLNLQQDEYISLGGREAGVRVTITPPDVRPLPDEDGITIRPGVVTAIALRFVSIIISASIVHLHINMLQFREYCLLSTVF